MSKFCCQDTLRTAPSALKKLVAALVPALGDKAVSNLVLHHVFEPAASLIAIKSGCLDCGISQLLRWLIASRSQLCKRSEFHLAERGAVSASQVAKDLTREPIEVDGNLCRSVSINFSLLFPLSSSNKGSIKRINSKVSLRRTTHTLPLSSPLTHTHSDHCTSEDATRGLEVLRSRLCAFVERSVAAQEEAGEGEGGGADRAAEPSRRDIAIGETVQSLLQASTRTVSGADSLDHVLSIFCDCNLFIVRCVNTPRTKIGEACKDDGVYHLGCSSFSFLARLLSQLH